jgi:hypothetical protein
VVPEMESEGFSNTDVSLFIEEKNILGTASVKDFQIQMCLFSVKKRTYLGRPEVKQF